jgi:ubiquinone/menaquinone biosynthesis C-methylase UbiE
MSDSQRHGGPLYRPLAGTYDLFDLQFPKAGRDNPRLALAAKVPDEPVRILDVCTGTASTALAVARTHPRAQIDGIDLSPDMLAVAAGKARRSGVRNLSVQGMDAARLTFADGEFDIAMVSFALHEMPEPVMLAVLGEMSRVLRAGGRLYIIDWAWDRSWFRNLFLRLELAFEPRHILQFLAHDWASLLQGVGLRLEAVERCRVSQLICARKELGAGRAEERAAGAPTSGRGHPLVPCP